ncbi:hypothetical protein AZE42_12642 [Rhizopogon vesiculosus]|uniref:HAT C-terminal dimerisation domain-containing protein n=1 Tax=Rhizopogon vesiculosus TaxID=180088 RepID=A0A1J8Q2I9_9AGAM|nr:hypothetical protein AZE42_12642 [Rhizopogon vesiculosus]
MAIFVEPFTIMFSALDQAKRDVTSTNGASGLIHLAMHILSIVPNSTATEHIFSQFGVIHTKLRNCLDPEKVHKQALVKSNTIAQHGSL